ncbi:tetratricopeptide repeat protein 24 isoform X2 [Cuculus canorus]|uniref:tetratricopeptide repeat protein 24 isoform X2 n=1 Tax=Cuculus canorus TaxID=55661 RepID=UPI0023AAC8AA|nr:tetratricopeptide repeat protein 24 isoform X2 [Cuculus canorus]
MQPRTRVSMASEEAADPGAQPMAPTAPGIQKKRLKKGKEKLEAKEGAQEGRDEVAKQEAEIEGLTRAGRRALARGDAQEAVECFRKALLLSRNTQLHRACAFNLGAAYVETGKPKKGLEFLLKSQPLEGESREHLNDLYFNINAAHEGLQDFSMALECLGKDVGHDGTTQAGSRAGTRVQMGCCFLGMREPARAARCFLEAAQSYLAASSPEAAAVALSRASGSMLQSRRFRAAEITGVLAQCRSLCASIADPALRGKLYNDIGLSYSQLRIFSLAAESFQEALALCCGGRDRRKAAALLQNLGAAHNALCSFGTALGWHRRAVALHGALGNRRAQGQCFGNLAYACSRLGKHEAAAENYLHALQAFQDAGDVQGQWQVCEGLGTACFHLGDPQKAIGHYKEALTLLSHCQETSKAARKRVVDKLTEAIQYQLCLHRCPFGPGGGLAPTPAPEPRRLRFCSTLPHTSRKWLQRSEVSRSFKVRAQPGDELCMPGAHRGRSERGAALTDGLTLEPHNPHIHLDTPGKEKEEDQDGSSVAPGCLSEPHTDSNLNTTRLHHGGLQTRRRDHQTLRLSSLEGSAANSTGCQEPHGSQEPHIGNREPHIGNREPQRGSWMPRTKSQEPHSRSRMPSHFCSLV